MAREMWVGVIGGLWTAYSMYRNTDTVLSRRDPDTGNRSNRCNYIYTSRYWNSDWEFWKEMR